jgi:hypothetical protein
MLVSYSGCDVPFAVKEALALTPAGDGRRRRNADAAIGMPAEDASRIEPEPVHGHVD